MTEYNQEYLLNLRLAAPQVGGLTGPERLLKRLFDVLVSALLLVLLSPLLLLLAALIRLDTRGPVFFRQQRVGEAGRLFWMLKFRSMINGADQYESELWRMAQGQLLFDKRPADVRITRLGRWLRRASLDELPQLVNVLKGDMSLVGPRPELPWLVARYEPGQRQRLTVPQGMTGWWQVNGRMTRALLHQRLADDLFYVENYSFWLDLRILWKTVGVVIRGEGAY